MRLKHQDTQDVTGPPKDASGKPAQRFAWKVSCGMCI